MRPPPTTRYLDALTYAALAATVLVGAAAFVSPLAAVAELLYPAAALFAAALLLWRKPALYLGFMWWVWFLTPAVRRLVDLQVGYTDASPVMLAPFLVTGVALAAVLPRLGNLPRPYRLPFAFAAAGLLYSYAVGVLRNGPVAATFDLLTWGVPVVSGAFVLTRWEQFTEFRAAILRTFSWGLVVMGGYALIQYFYLPAWDGYWMDNAGLGSIGVSEPQQVRVFSTLNSPGPFANVVMAGLLLVFARGGVVSWLGAVAGLAGFALSAVRAAWGGWAVGLLVMALGLPLRQRTRLIGALVLLTLVVVPLFSVGPLAAQFSQRFSSLADLSEDDSFNERLELYASFSAYTVGNPLGRGLGSTGVASGISARGASLEDLDSGLIAVVYTFGVLGTLYFVGGAAVLFGTALLQGLRSRDLSEASYVGVTAAIVGQLAFGNAWVGVSGMVLWFFPCLYLAARRYAEQQAEVGAADELRTRPAALPARKGYGV